MKAKDFLLIGAVVLISVIIALIGSKVLFGSSSTGQEQAEKVGPISSAFPAPDSHYFNAHSFDPTQAINVTSNNNTDPFNSTAQ